MLTLTLTRNSTHRNKSTLTNASEIWPDKRGGIIYKKGIIVQIIQKKFNTAVQHTYKETDLQSHHDKH